MSLQHASTALMAEVEALMLALIRDAAPPNSHPIAAPCVLADIAEQHLQTGGKRLRARLALAATAALGGSMQHGVLWAAACELSHNATLIHDDLQDGDVQRRGQPTTWVRHGAAQAINAGDLLLMLPFLALAPLAAAPPKAPSLLPAAAPPPAWGFALQQSLAQHMAAVIRGQAVECALTHGGAASRSAYQQMVRGKTAALFELPVHGAALMSGCDAAQAHSLVAPFAPLGLLFQMQDDVLDLWGAKGRTAAGSDLREGKISALVVEHLALHPQDTPWLTQLLRQPREQTQQAAVQKAIDRFASGGALQAVLGAINRAAQAARAQVQARLAPLLEDLLQLILQPIAGLEAVQQAQPDAQASGLASGPAGHKPYPLAPIAAQVVGVVLPGKQAAVLQDKACLPKDPLEHLAVEEVKVTR
jgi:geranylgeranyl diphosphate synthase type I